MAALPVEVLYGTVTGQLIGAGVDTTSDVDENPDAIPIVGTVTFKPSAASLNDATGKAIILPLPVTVTLDANGNIASPDGTIGVNLIASDSPNIQPINFQWNVSFNLIGVNLSGFNFYLPNGVTRDLAQLLPVASQPGVYITKGDPGPAGPMGPAGSGISNVVYKHGPPTDPSAYPVGTFVVDIDDYLHIYEITA